MGIIIHYNPQNFFKYFTDGDLRHKFELSKNRRCTPSGPLREVHQHQIQMHSGARASQASSPSPLNCFTSSPDSLAGFGCQCTLTGNDMSTQWEKVKEKVCEISRLTTFSLTGGTGGTATHSDVIVHSKVLLANSSMQSRRIFRKLCATCSVARHAKQMRRR